MSKLDEIEGIGPAFARKLADAGLETTGDLLTRGGTPQGRAEIATASGISETLILRWVNHADLFRLDGVGGEYAELLEATGVDTVVELARRNAANLTGALAETNAKRDLVRRLPSEATVEGWIAEAKTLERAVHH
jgi:predicted flap endonuclease-1-like 5' DNA nuclease